MKRHKTILFIVLYCLLLLFIVNCNNNDFSSFGSSGLSSDATLSSLSLSAGSLSPSFDPDKSMYTVSVGFLLNDISITPSASDSGAEITVNDSLAVSGSAGSAIMLNQGLNTITISVLAEDGITGKDYNLTIDKESANDFAQRAYVKASNTGADDGFGYSVAVSGDTIVVGARYEDSNSTGVTNGSGDSDSGVSEDSGAAYVFVRNGTTWSQQAYLKASNTGTDDYFGYSVAVSGNTIVIGAYNEDSNATGVTNGSGYSGSDTGLTNNSGAAYVFIRNDTTWTQQAYIKASNAQSYDYFGLSVAVSGDTIVVGAYNEDSDATGVTNGTESSGSDSGLTDGSGAAYVFVRNDTTWSQQAYLKASNTGADDRFGYSVAISDNTIVIGADYEDSDAAGVTNGSGYSGSDTGTTDNSGAAYVFARNNTTWSQQAYIKASNTELNDHFGVSVSVSEDTIVIGANYEDSNATGVTNGTGDSGSDSGLTDESGAAYVFARNNTTWSQQAYLKASNTGSSDHFGYSVAVSDNTIIVGAYSEDSDAAGVTHGSGYSGSDTGSTDGSGAAYLFTRTGTTWSQQAYLKASNTGAIDYFGTAVSVSNDIIVIGADYEDSDAAGVTHGPGYSGSDTGTTDESGAVYIFR